MPGSQQYHEKLCLINYELAINVYDFKKLITKHAWFTTVP